ncbi:hypothetical protein [Paenibacillus eucommiae]|uniref:DUF1292 domain-containing protein n=1 Tax=Paenibacillus eucommiae TaxID=1355755 RepID=A0ABS4IN56_9BACL|nr:hypothetical protein [Paenibacillus eucommiae]MBP1988998.1 hypothetical protein [Paenibacillus eucommiae]
MIIDYHEVERNGDELLIYIGIQFEDEPDSLYVVSITAGDDGTVKEWKLLYNGVDCKYTFKPEEKQALQLSLAEDDIQIHESL